LGAAIIKNHSDIPLESISNALNINESRVKKELKNIDNIKNPKSDKSKNMSAPQFSRKTQNAFKSYRGSL
jgi:hypothetical protein